MSQGNGNLNAFNATGDVWQQPGERIPFQQNTFPNAPNGESHNQLYRQKQAQFAVPSPAALDEYKKVDSLSQTTTYLSPTAAPEHTNLSFNRDQVNMATTYTNPAAAAVAHGHVHTLLWAAAESHFRKAQTLYRSSIAAQTANDQTVDWKPSIVAGLACLYSVVRICAAPRSQMQLFGKELTFSPDTEAKTRLRIALVLSEWCDDQPFNADNEQSEEELQLTRALLTLPNAECYLPTRYAIVAAHCRMFLRRGEYRWAEQKLKAACSDTQKRLNQHHWTHHFVLELSKLYMESGDIRSAISSLRYSIALAQRSGDKEGEAVASVQMLGQLVQMRNWTAAGVLIERIDALVADTMLAGAPPVRTRFWTLKAVAAIMVGSISVAQEACDAAREALNEWQHIFARQLASGEAAYGGSIAATVGAYNQEGTASHGTLVRGACYYEAHAWVMLVSALAVNGDNAYEESIGFLQRALDGIARGELDGFKQQLQQLELHILLHAVDIGLASLHVREAKSALDQAVTLVAVVESSIVSENGKGKLRTQEAVWHSNRDAIALRWAMYLHRTGEFDAAEQAYQCVINNGTGDLCYAAQVNLAIMHLCAPEITDATKVQVRQLIQGLLQASQDSILAPNIAKERQRAALLEFVQGLESSEPVKSKTHLLACLQVCSEVANTALQGWTLCVLGTQMLPAGQYGQAMKMCGVGQTIAHRANDPLQKAAAIGILTHIEKAVGDPERRAKLLELDQRLLEEFNTLIAEAQ